MTTNGTSWGPENRLDLDYLKEKLRWSFEYHLDEYAQRLKEIGGLGVGGTELEYTPLKGAHIIDTDQKQQELALSLSMSRLWDQASWSFVQGHFCACILLIAATVERALKYELTRQNKDSIMTLHSCIGKCRKYKILPNDNDDEIVKAAEAVNAARDDVIHANVELKRAGELLAGIVPEHEVVPLSGMPEQMRKCVVTGNDERTFLPPEQEASTRIVFEYKASAKSTRQNALRILKYLYENVQAEGRIETYQIPKRWNTRLPDCPLPHNRV